METSKTPYPGGSLLIAADGSIEEGPSFLLDALRLGPDESIYHAFDTKRPSHLTLNRVVATSTGVLEYHALMVCEGMAPKYVRFWDISDDLESGRSGFYFVDDTSSQLSHEWALRRARRQFLIGATEYVSDVLVGPLAGLRSLTEVLRDRPEDGPEAAERILLALDALEASVRGIARLGDGPLSSQKQMLRIADLEPVLASWSERAVAVTLLGSLETDAEIPAFVLERVLAPVVQNAIEAGPISGTVRLEVGVDDDEIVFEVVDDGCGMTAVELERCEDPFYSTKRGHAGLGLSGASEALAALHGSWTMVSDRREGTRIRIVLPRD